MTEKYSYFFGVDNVDMLYKTINKNCCRITNEIEIGTLADEEYIQLEAEYTQFDSSVEFYIVDGDMEIPILPLKDELVYNEKIFFGLQPRFSIDNSAPIIIKKNGIQIEMSLEEAIKQNTDLYTVTYKPANAYIYKPFNSSIKIKTVLRLYDDENKVPFIKNIRIRKYGGNALWMENIMK